MLMLHGDEFDKVVNEMRLLSAFGDWMYDGLLWLTRQHNRIRSARGKRYWSLAAAVKRRVKYICLFVSHFEENLANYAREHGADIVLTGHIHRPEMTWQGDILYCNGGDWVENCTAMVEHFDGRLEILHPLRDGLDSPCLEAAAATEGAVLLEVAG
jgi:UDP-2,3-diacylglucosamine pyrophosphatase LpxH